MLKKIINLLRWLDESNTPKKVLELFFSILFLGVSIFITVVFGIMPLIRGIGEMPKILILSLYSIAFIVCFTHMIWRKFHNYDFSLIAFFVNYLVPLYTGLAIFNLWSNEQLFPLYITICILIFCAYPFFRSFGSVPLIGNNTVYRHTLYLWKIYQTAFYTGSSIFLLVFFSGDIVSLLLSMIFDNSSYYYYERSWFIILWNIATQVATLIIGALVWWTLVSYAWDHLGEEVIVRKRKKILLSSVLVSLVFFSGWIGPRFYEAIIDSRIEKAENIIQQWGANKTSFDEVNDIWFLKQAFIKKYLNHNLYSREEELFEQIYDTSIESMVKEKVDVDDFQGWSSNATSEIARGENAKVELRFAQHDTEILKDIGATKTTITYEFQNTDNSNEEVIFKIALPGSESAITSLRLGMNLEFEGIIAPRGAASKVYQDSLRRNTDPALLEQTGPATYRLRVFPVTPLNNEKTHGRQKVQFSFVSPIPTDGTVTLIPQTDIINLRLTESSQILTRLSEGATVIDQGSKSGDSLELLSKKTTYSLKNPPADIAHTYCNLNEYTDFDSTQLSPTTTGTKNKNIVFFDISRSVGDSPKIKQQYQDLINAWKNAGIALDIFTYNFEVYPAGYDITNMDFWGTTDMSKVIEYISKNGIKNANIIIITDDSSYEQGKTELKDLDYKNLKSNRISLIQIGEDIRDIKTEVTKAIFATNGLFVTLDASSPISDTLRNIFTHQKTTDNCSDYTGSSSGVLQSIQGYRDSRNWFGESYSLSGVVVKKPKAFSGSIFYGGTSNPLIMKLLSGSIIQDADQIMILESPLSTWGENFYTGRLWIGSELMEPAPSQAYSDFHMQTFNNYTGGYLAIASVSSDEIVIHYQILEKRRVYKSETRKIPRKDMEKEWQALNYEEIIEPQTRSNNMIQESIAKTAHIINQHTSLIALEAEWQKDRLEQYSQEDDRYDTSYDNLGAENTSWRDSFGFFDSSDSLGGGSVFSLRSVASPNSLSSGMDFSIQGTSIGIGEGAGWSDLDFGNEQTGTIIQIVTSILFLICSILLMNWMMRKKIASYGGKSSNIAESKTETKDGDA